MSIIEYGNDFHIGGDTMRNDSYKTKQKEGKSGDDKAILIKLTSQKVVQKIDKEEKQEENEQQLDPSYVKDINDSLKQQKDIPSQMSIEEDQKQEDQKEEDNDLNDL